MNQETKRNTLIACTGFGLCGALMLGSALYETHLGRTMKPEEYRDRAEANKTRNTRSATRDHVIRIEAIAKQYKTGIHYWNNGKWTDEKQPPEPEVARRLLDTAQYLAEHAKRTYCPATSTQEATKCRAYFDGDLGVIARERAALPDK